MDKKTIKERVIEYRNTHKEVRVLLGVLLGEFERTEMDVKRKITGPVTDEEATAIIKKLMDANKQCQTEEENPTLALFLPEQLSVAEIVDIIEAIEATSVGECMKYFKDYYPGQYDGKQVSTLFNAYLKK